MPRHLTGDAHEWINEIPTVPTYSLANLQPSQRSWVYLCVITFDVTRFNFFRQGFFVFYNKLCYEQQRGKKTLLSLTLICYCHLVGMAKIVRGSTFVRPWNTATWRFGWLTVQSWHCLDLYYKLTCTLPNGSLTSKTALDRPCVIYLMHRSSDCALVCRSLSLTIFAARLILCCVPIVVCLACLGSFALACSVCGCLPFKGATACVFVSWRYLLCIHYTLWALEITYGLLFAAFTGLRL